MWRAPVGEGAKRRRGDESVIARPMLPNSRDLSPPGSALHRMRRMWVGCHVSTAGGLAKAIDRGRERGCEAIQIFHQSPRMWRPTKYGPGDFAALRQAEDA